MRLNRDARRILAQFLSGLAVSSIATLILAPLAAGTTQPATVVGALAVAAILCVAALLVR
jgi:hypothetical protein